MRMTLAVMVGMLSLSAVAEEAGGLAWQSPAGWKVQPERPMRVATYKIPAAKGDAEEAELGIFYFGAGQGGTVQANLDRWYGQFQEPDGKPAAEAAKTKKETVHGIPVTRVDLAGTFLFSASPMMMGPTTAKPNFRLLGAIAEGSEGAVFFKLTGPAKTVAAAEGDFKKLIGSLKKAH